jgi:1,4-dihydroxy-2-naphthoate octaprenyltransferase
MKPSIVPPHTALPQWKVWLLAARPRTLPASIACIIVGGAVAAARGYFQWLPFMAALCVAVLLQVGANFANDLFDFLKGADAARTGPTRVLQSGLISPPQMWAGIGLVLGLAALLGLYLTTIGGWPILVLGLFAMAAVLAYTGGPWPLGYHGLGDVLVFVVFGPLAVMGMDVLFTGTASLLSLIASVPVGLFITAILIVNNLRDINTDRAAHKRTLAVRIGPAATRLEYALCIAGAYATPLVLWLVSLIGNWFWLAWLTMPLALRLVRDLYTAREPMQFNRLLARTAQVNLIFSVLFAVSLLLR